MLRRETDTLSSNSSYSHAAPATALLRTHYYNRHVPNSTTSRTPAIRTCCTAPPTDKLTTILQLVVQQICHIAMPEPNISTCQDVGMWQIFVRWW